VKNILRGMKVLSGYRLRIPVAVAKHQAFRAGKNARLPGNARNVSLAGKHV
jgi:hypothetical protein